MWLKKYNNSIKQAILIFILLLLVSCWNTEITKNNTFIDKKEMQTENFINQYFEQIDVVDFKKEMADEEKIIIDVRTPWELPVYGKITENQILIDINNPNFISEIAKLDKSKKYLIYCWHWNRSVTARQYMQREGFSYVKDLAWGIDEWEKLWENVIK